MSSPSQKDLKKALRQQIKTRLAPLGQLAISTQSTRAQQTVLSLQQYQTAKRVGIYLSMPRSEAQTDLLIKNAFEKDQDVFVPRLHSVPSGFEGKKRKTMDMLRLNSIGEYEALEQDSWGIPSLGEEGVERRENAMGGIGLSSNEDASGGLDVIVIPGVAFDREGARMGHGAGFYDAFLSRFCTDGKRKKPYLVGLCLAEQLLEPGEIVMQSHDWRVDAVAVGDGSLHVI